MRIKNDKNMRLHKSVEIKQVSTDESKPNTLYIEGYATFYQSSLGIKEVDRDLEIVNLDGLDTSSFEQNPVLLWNHNWNEVRGRVIEITKDTNGLKVKAEMQRLTGKEADFENVLHGNVKSFSIGFIPLEYEYLEDAVEITKAELIELSIAPVQSNRSALFQVVGTKSLDVSQENLKELLQDTQKETTMKVNAKEVKDEPKVDEPKAEEPKVEVKDEPKAEEPKVEPKKEEPKAEEPKVEPKKEEPKADSKLDPTVLASAIVEAQQEAEKLKQEKEVEAQQEAERLEKESLEAEAQKVQDALNYVRTMRDKFKDTPAEELDIDSFDEFVDVVTDTNDVIMDKINELLSGVSGAPEGE